MHFFSSSSVDSLLFCSFPALEYLLNSLWLLSYILRIWLSIHGKLPLHLWMELSSGSWMMYDHLTALLLLFNLPLQSAKRWWSRRRRGRSIRKLMALVDNIVSPRMDSSRRSSIELISLLYVTYLSWPLHQHRLATSDNISNRMVSHKVEKRLINLWASSMDGKQKLKE